ncbi:hypothetical protein DL93DRAFT_351275 [Clavulina sp. PMI_390]|nr:hypothetical protein DL93DRAFT_351275 [Clavulina sp. PMI_390]
MDPELEATITTTQSILEQSPKNKVPAVASTIEALFLLLDNVKQLTVIQVDRTTLEMYYLYLSNHFTEVSDQVEHRVPQDVESLTPTALRILEGWLPKSKLWELSTINLPSDAVAQLLKTPSPISSLSVIPPVQNSSHPNDIQPLVSLTLRSLRTSVHWAQAFLSPTSPSHSLVLLDVLPLAGNGHLGRRMAELPSPVKILQAEKMTLFYLTMMVIGIHRGGTCPNLRVIVHSSRGIEEKGILETRRLTARLVYLSFNMHQSLHTYVLRIAHYPHQIWADLDAPSAFARDLANKMTALDGRSPPPRVILELGTLGTPDFVCWIFTTKSRNEWTCQKEDNVIEDSAEREDILYLNRS